MFKDFIIYTVIFAIALLIIKTPSPTKTTFELKTFSVPYLYML